MSIRDQASGVRNQDRDFGPLTGAPEPMRTAPLDGRGILAYGIHSTDNGLYWHKGDQWWAIIVWDAWREPPRWVFLKDGMPTWSEPLCWAPFLEP